MHLAGAEFGGAMFLRIVRAAGGNGTKHEYVRVVEAYRDKGKTKHRTIINLGRKDLLAKHLDLDKLQRLLHGDEGSDRGLQREDIARSALGIGDRCWRRGTCGPNWGWTPR